MVEPLPLNSAMLSSTEVAAEPLKHRQVMLRVGRAPERLRPRREELTCNTPTAADDTHQDSGPASRKAQAIAATYTHGRLVAEAHPKVSWLGRPARLGAEANNKTLLHGSTSLHNNQSKVFC